MYQALENTIKTPSELLRYTYNSMRDSIALEIGLQSYSSFSDSELLYKYNEGVCQYSNTLNTVTRRRRSAVSENLANVGYSNRSYDTKIG